MSVETTDSQGRNGGLEGQETMPVPIERREIPSAALLIPLP